MNRRFAEFIDIDIRAQSLTIDGEPFPYKLEKNSIEVITRDDDCAGVRFTLLANQGVRLNDIEEQTRMADQDQRFPWLT